ncbi:MAG: 5-formyltetrahydrofolate cyclo-ligase [Rhodospirillales bacterium]|nr:5-formyltetrahydrofolate cyclo-ligase [Rhodospirillales bacterium]
MAVTDDDAPDLDTITREKLDRRKHARALRLIADQKLGPEAAMSVAKHVLAALGDLGIGAGTTVAGYWPIDTEIDPRLLLARLHERAVICSLPVVTERDAPLEFREWAPTDDLAHGPYGTRHPKEGCRRVIPQVLFTPLLAFDGDGFRLGHGAGYYDRTLALLRAQGPVTAIGVAFALQRTDRLPRGAHDQPLDWIVTEDGLEQFQS